MRRDQIVEALMEHGVNEQRALDVVAVDNDDLAAIPYGMSGAFLLRMPVAYTAAEPLVWDADVEFHVPPIHTWTVHLSEIREVRAA